MAAVLLSMKQLMGVKSTSIDNNLSSGAVSLFRTALDVFEILVCLLKNVITMCFAIPKRMNA